MRNILYSPLLILGGCAFDTSLLGPRDAGLLDAPSLDANAEDSPLVPDSAEGDVATLGDVTFDVSEDTGTDAFEVPDVSSFEDTRGLSCTDFPDISGTYRLNRRLMECLSSDLGTLPLVRTDACSYQWDDGISDSSRHIFYGDCEVFVVGENAQYECQIHHWGWVYRCSMSPVSGGLNMDCYFVSGASPVTTAPCAFFSPSS